jgi:hypothetical protein
MRHSIRPDSLQPWTVDFDDASSRYEIRNHAPGHDPRIIATGIRFEKDAFFIAHAANIHDELVEALRKVNRVISEYDDQFNSGKLPDELRQKLRVIAGGMLEELGEKP